MCGHRIKQAIVGCGFRWPERFEWGFLRTDHLDHGTLQLRCDDLELFPLWRELQIKTDVGLMSIACLKLKRWPKFRAPGNAPYRQRHAQDLLEVHCAEGRDREAAIRLLRKFQYVEV